MAAEQLTLPLDRPEVLVRAAYLIRKATRTPEPYEQKLLLELYAVLSELDSFEPTHAIDEAERDRFERRLLELVQLPLFDPKALGD